MAVTSYNGVTWSDDEPIYTSKLNQMSQNEQYLFENAPTVYYKAHGVTRQTGIKIAAGVTPCTRSGGYRENTTINFGTFFTTGCNPVVTHSMLHTGEVRVHWGHKGIGTTLPDHRGFEIYGNLDSLNLRTNYLTRNYYISWIAIGY